MAQTRLESEPCLGKIAFVRLKFLLALSAYFFTPAESKRSSLFVWTVVSWWSRFLSKHILLILDGTRKKKLVRRLNPTSLSFSLSVLYYLT